MADMIERDAKLFEAGNYEDKGVEITEDDLDRLVDSFGDPPPPVRIEHTDTPFDGAIGVLKSISRRGRDLMGRIAFSPEAWALIDKAGARRLSVCIRRDKSALMEVSLVQHPRVASAAVFDDRLELEGALEFGEIPPECDATDKTTSGPKVPDTKEVTTMSEDVKTFTEDDVARKIAEECDRVRADAEAKFSEQLSQRDAQIAALETDRVRRDAQAVVDGFVSAGKLAPAAVPFAMAILTAPATPVTFAEEQLTIGALFSKLMEAQPAVVSFSEQGRDSGNSAASFSTDQVEFARKLGVTVEDLEKYGARA